MGTFFFCKNLKVIEFSEDSEILSIEREAFFQTSLSTISIPKNVKKIGERASLIVKI